jgi:cytochrome c oxidase subunit 3
MAMLRGMLVLGLILGTAFLVNQVINWFAMINIKLPPTSRNLFTFTFYMLTGLHAAHVIGGLIQLSVVTVRAYRGAYSPSYHPGVTYSVMYWHFLDIVWLVMFFTMQILS